MNDNTRILRTITTTTDRISEDEEVGSGNLFVDEGPGADANMSGENEEAIIVCDTVSSDDYDSPGEDWAPAESPKKTTTLGVSNMSFVSEVLSGPPHINISYLTEEIPNVSITKFRNISVM